MHAFCMQNACKRNPCSLTEVRFSLHLHHRRMRRAFGFFSSILRLPVGADGSEGGGGAGGDGGGSRSEPGGDGAAKTGITKDEADAMITKAINARLKTFAEQQTKTLETFGATLTEKLLGGLDEKLSALKPADPKDKPKDPADLSQHPQFRALQKQNEDLAKAVQAEQAEKAQAKAKARSEALRRTVEATLQEAGIAKTAHAAGYLIDTAKLVGYEDDESESIVFRDEGGALPLKKGLSDWAKSDDGKLYLPARQASGSGDLGAGGGARRGTPPSSGPNPAAPSRALIGESLLAISGMQSRQ